MENQSDILGAGIGFTTLTQIGPTRQFGDAIVTTEDCPVRAASYR